MKIETRMTCPVLSAYYYCYSVIIMTRLVNKPTGFDRFMAIFAPTTIQMRPANTAWRLFQLSSSLPSLFSIS